MRFVEVSFFFVEEVWSGGMVSDKYIMWYFEVFCWYVECRGDYWEWGVGCCEDNFLFFSRRLKFDYYISVVI